MTNTHKVGPYLAEHEMQRLPLVLTGVGDREDGEELELGKELEGQSPADWLCPGRSAGPNPGFPSTLSGPGHQVLLS